jgi:hypothetical protein
MLVPMVSASSSRGRSRRDIVLCAASRVGSSPANCRGNDQSRTNPATRSAMVCLNFIVRSFRSISRPRCGACAPHEQRGGSARCSRSGHAADQQSQLDSRKDRAHRRVPAWRTLAARRQVAASSGAAGIAQTDRHNRNATLVVENLAIESEPFAQPVAAAVVERDPGLVHPRSRRLADDQQPGRGSSTQDRSRPLR